MNSFDLNPSCLFLSFDTDWEKMKNNFQKKLLFLFSFSFLFIYFWSYILWLLHVLHKFAWLLLPLLLNNFNCYNVTGAISTYIKGPIFYSSLCFFCVSTETYSLVIRLTWYLKIQEPFRHQQSYISLLCSSVNNKSKTQHAKCG